MKSLPNNRLILNGHKLHTRQELLDYITKRLGLTEPMHDISQIIGYKKDYHIESIVIRHGDTFLQDESKKEQIRLRSYLD